MTRLPRPQANILPGGDLTPSGSLFVDSLGAVGGVLSLVCRPSTQPRACPVVKARLPVRHLQHQPSAFLRTFHFPQQPTTSIIYYCKHLSLQRLYIESIAPTLCQPWTNIPFAFYSLQTMNTTPTARPISEEPRLRYPSLFALPQRRSSR